MPLSRAACWSLERIVWMLVAFVIASVPGEAKAAETVAVVASPETPLAERVGREVEAASFDVIYQRPPLRELPGALALRRECVAVVWSAAASVHVWVRRDDATAEQRSFAEPGDDVAAIRETALGVAEFIRGVRRGPAAVAQPPRVAPAPQSELPHALFVSAQGGAVAGLAHDGASGHALLGLTWRPPVPGLLISAEGITPTAPARITEGSNEARVFAGAMYIAVRVGVSGPRDRVHFDIGPGIGLALAGVYGRADPPLRSNDEILPSAALLGRTGLAVALGSRIRLRLDGMFGTLVPRLGVRFEGRDVAVWGQPFGGGFAGLEVRVL